VQAQVGIDRILGGLIQVDGGSAHLSTGVTFGVVGDERIQLIGERKVGGLG